MTDKQIIIDGVDVSGCLFYYDNGKCSAILGDDACKDWHNCSYKLQKQLDQLKAENENWQKEYWKLEQGNDFLAETNSRLKQTLTEIKEMLKEICMEECLFDWNKTSKKHCGDCDCRYGQILQKISECEVE